VLVVLLVTPWWSFDWHPHFEKVRWIPFVSPPLRLRDILLNVLLYVPLGYWHVRARRRSIWRAVLFALTLSAATESTQVFSDRRFPSTTDLSTNVIGALAGAWWASRRHLEDV
jgi:glycopeptide antibiotics resistance protein